ncbi:hypothetical protein WN943_009660 [Citrus x changshan-huyou]
MLEQSLKILSERKLLPWLKSEMLVYLIKKKSDVFLVFKEYKARVELKSGKKIKCLRTDNGGGYTNDEFLAFCKQEGIQRRFMIAYTPQQNRVAEWINRTLTERIRDMLRTAGLPNSFWAKAAKTVCYIVNRSPSIAIGLKTTMKMWTGKPADYSYLHAFGCLVYVIYNAQERIKLDPKSRRCILLRYADGVKRYRLWDPTAHKIVISRDVYVENNPEDSDSSKAAPEHEEQEPVESEAPEVRQSTRERQPLVWHSEYVTEINIAYCLLIEDGESSNFHETLNSSDVTLWMTAMQEEIEVEQISIRSQTGAEMLYRKPISTPLPVNFKLSSSMCPNNEAERKEMSRVPYASTVGSLIFAMICTRLDIAQAVGAVSRYMANRGGVVCWVSKLQIVVALSTTEAEYMAATQAYKEAIWIQRLLEKLGTKHIGSQYHFIREVVEDLADVLTKPINIDKCVSASSTNFLTNAQVVIGLNCIKVSWSKLLADKIVRTLCFFALGLYFMEIGCNYQQ